MKILLYFFRYGGGRFRVAARRLTAAGRSGLAVYWSVCCTISFSAVVSGLLHSAIVTGFLQLKNDTVWVVSGQLLIHSGPESIWQVHICQKSECLIFNDGEYLCNIHFLGYIPIWEWGTHLGTHLIFSAKIQFSMSKKC